MDLQSNACSIFGTNAVLIRHIASLFSIRMKKKKKKKISMEDQERPRFILLSSFVAVILSCVLLRWGQDILDSPSGGYVKEG